MERKKLLLLFFLSFSPYALIRSAGQVEVEAPWQQEWREIQEQRQRARLTEPENVIQPGGERRPVEEVPWQRELREKKEMRQRKQEEERLRREKERVEKEAESLRQAEEEKRQEAERLRLEQEKKEQELEEARRQELEQRAEKEGEAWLEQAFKKEQEQEQFYNQTLKEREAMLEQVEGWKNKFFKLMGLFDLDQFKKYSEALGEIQRDLERKSVNAITLNDERLARALDRIVEVIGATMQDDVVELDIIHKGSQSYLASLDRTIGQLKKEIKKQKNSEMAPESSVFDSERQSFAEKKRYFDIKVDELYEGKDRTTLISRVIDLYNPALLGAPLKKKNLKAAIEKVIALEKEIASLMDDYEKKASTQASLSRKALKALQKEMEDLKQSIKLRAEELTTTINTIDEDVRNLEEVKDKTLSNLRKAGEGTPGRLKKEQKNRIIFRDF